MSDTTTPIPGEALDLAEVALLEAARRHESPREIAAAALTAAVPVLLDTERERAWDEGARCAGGYGHEDSWTHDMSPLLDNPYRAARIARTTTEGPDHG